jgi:dephospho-CoA kinase
VQSPAKVRVAITGGIAEGKSTVLGYLRDLGHSTASADEIARTVLGAEAVNRRIADLAGLPWPLDRVALRSALASDAQLRRAVNAVTHPLILAALRATDAEFFEVPLLIETCLQGEFDEVWVVTCGLAEQLRRLAARDPSEGVSASLRDVQLPTRAKTPFSDRIIRTNAAPESVRRLVSEAVTDLFGA